MSVNESITKNAELVQRRTAAELVRSTENPLKGACETSLLVPFSWGRCRPAHTRALALGWGRRVRQDWGCDPEWPECECKAECRGGHGGSSPGTRADDGRGGDRSYKQELRCPGHELERSSRQGKRGTRAVGWGLKEGPRGVHSHGCVSGESLASPPKGDGPSDRLRSPCPGWPRVLTETAAHLLCCSQPSQDSHLKLIHSTVIQENQSPCFKLSTQ